MKNTQYAKNGQLVSAVKTYEELTAAEKQKLIIPASDKLSDYANFQVRYNKQGKLLGVQGHDLSAAREAEVKTHAQKPDLIDGLTVLSAGKHSKQYQAAKRRLGVSGEQINRARRVVAHD